MFRLLFFLSICSIMNSCATANRWFDSEEKNRRMYTVRIDSRTKGLPVYYADKDRDRYVGSTPCTIYSDRCKIKYVTVRNGDVYQTIKLKSKPRTSSYWNFVPYPLYNWIWGFFLDQGTGRGKTYGQKDYYVDM